MSEGPADTVPGAAVDGIDAALPAAAHRAGTGQQAGAGSRRRSLLARVGLDGLGLADWLALATVFTASWMKLFIEPAGKLPYTTILAVAFIAVFAMERIRERTPVVPRAVVQLGAITAAVTLAYLLGFGNLQAPVERVQFGKGITVWLVQASFMVTLAWHVVLRGRRMLLLVAAAFVGGITVNALYGLAQLALLGAGLNLDRYVVTPLTLGQGKDGGAHHYGGNIYRINGLMRDTNHLGITAASAAAFSLGWLRGRRLLAVGGTNAATTIISLSRSAMLGLAAGVAVAGWLRRRTINVVAVAGAAATLVVAVVLFALAAPDLYTSIVNSRLNLEGQGSQTHLRLYGVVPGMLDQNPLTGMGLNTFAIELESTSGRQGFGPHSYYIQVLTETGVLGALATATLVGVGLAKAARLGTPVAMGVTAAIVATLLGNVFYLTAHLLLLKVLLALAYAAPAVEARHAMQEAR